MIAYAHGSDSYLEYGDWPDPTPDSTDVILKVGAAGVNRADLLLRQGGFGPLPAVPGIDAAGTITEIGREIDDIAVGTRVIVNPAITCGRCQYCLSGNHGTCRRRRAIGQGLDGSYAQYLRVPRVNVHPIRDDLSFEEAAAMPAAFFTAWQILMMRANLRAGETVLITGAAGGVGSAALQIARLVGARVIAAVGSDSKIALTTRWADVAINYSTENLGERALAATDGEGVEVVVDTVGASLWEHYMKAVRAGGRITTCSFTAGRKPDTDILTLITKQLAIYGSGGSGSKPAVAAVVKLINERRLTGVLDRVIALKDAELAHSLLADRAVAGKIVLRP